MGYVILFIVLSWISAIFGVVYQVKAARTPKVSDGNALMAWRIQNVATFSWTAAYILLTISMTIFVLVKA